MTQALAPFDTSAVPAVVITDQQLDLIRRTVAQGATADELQLYLYDCRRRGVHPLDKLIHFTKRGGKYTPITSIDFMRGRAADTGVYAGNDDAIFAGTPKTDDFAATVTVWKIVSGQRCPFTATARWPEYKPRENDFMWLKMPHTMLGKCSEALALRKAFPQQLQGLYAREEMDQAGAEPLVVQAQDVLPAAERAPCPEGAVFIEQVSSAPTRNKNVTKVTLTLSTGEQVGTINTNLGKLAEQIAQENVPAVVQTKETKWGVDLTELKRWQPDAGPALREPGDDDEPPVL